MARSTMSADAEDAENSEVSFGDTASGIDGAIARLRRRLGHNSRLTAARALHEADGDEDERARLENLVVDLVGDAHLPPAPVHGDAAAYQSNV